MNILWRTSAPESLSKVIIGYLTIDKSVRATVPIEEHMVATVKETP
jgi:hypothetical protein